MASTASAKRTGSRTLRANTAVDALGARERAGNGRVERDTGGRNRNRPEGVDEALLKRSHLRAVKRVLHGQQPGATPRAASAASASSSAAVSPESTTLRGPLIAPSESLAPYGCTTSIASAGVSATEAIRPRPVACCMMWPRCQTTRTASASGSTPATWSAASSPTLWPTTPSGAIPHDFQSAARPPVAQTAPAARPRFDRGGSPPRWRRIRPSSDQPESGRRS